MAAGDVQCLPAAVHPVPAEHGLHPGPGAATLTHHSQVSAVLGALVLEKSRHTELCPGLTQQVLAPGSRLSLLSFPVAQAGSELWQQWEWRVEGPFPTQSQNRRGVQR